MGKTYRYDPSDREQKLERDIRRTKVKRPVVEEKPKRIDPRNPPNEEDTD